MSQKREYASFRKLLSINIRVALGDYSKIILKLQAANKTQHLTTLQTTDIEYSLANIKKHHHTKKPTP